MKIVSKDQVVKFQKKHSRATAVITLYNALEEEDFKNNKEVTERFSRSSVMKNRKDTIVFRVGGNKYRLIIKFNYKFNLGRILFIGTHPEYDDYLKLN
ncbi:type II toxin-antitoxin system HigB family toxin [Marinilabiliaceae bacterium JC040]|nr:type II toxin-antitoxin system HigB family toxin [Marinilabiliaceae bacterium JC040]